VKLLTAYLVDDEPLALARLSRLLKQTGLVEVAGSATESEAAVTALTRDPTDLCFLDIHMPRLNGFEVLQRLPRQPIVIFTTAHDQYALQAFAANAVDYLLKPIARDALDRAIAKAGRMATALTATQPQWREMLQALAQSWRAREPEFPERIASRSGERIVFLDLARVSHFYAQDKVTFAMMEGKAYCVDHSIADLEARLNPRKFLRIHRGTVVNITWIREVSPLPGGSLHVRLLGAPGAELTVARDRAKEFKLKVGW
jgi:two-component system, LytTR family, response regulator